MKKQTWLTILTALVLALGSIGAVYAEIIPPDEPGQQIGYIAVVLCEELTLREKPRKYTIRSMAPSTNIRSRMYLRGRMPRANTTTRNISEAATVSNAVILAAGKMIFLLFLYAIRRAFSCLVNCGFSDIANSSKSFIFYYNTGSV